MCRAGPGRAEAYSGPVHLRAGRVGLGQAEAFQVQVYSFSQLDQTWHDFFITFFIFLTFFFGKFVFN